MQLAIMERVEKTREQLETWRKSRLEELQSTAESLATASEQARKTLLARKDETVGTLNARKEEAVDQARERLVTVQANVLETARDLLGWAGTQIGPRAEFLKRGEEALEEALVALRAGHSATLPLDGFDDLSVKNAISALDDASVDHAGLRTLRAYEAANKNRKTMLAELDRRIELLAGASANDAVSA